MVYTNNVPQGNQTIASTTTPIRNNFAFIETDLQAEHSFNGNVPGLTEGAHKFCSMPNRALSPAIPPGANGIYFVSSGKPYFYDGTTNFQLNYLGAQVTIQNGVGAGSNFQILAAGNWFGTVSTFLTDQATRYQFYQFRMVGGVLTYNSMASGGSSALRLLLNTGNLRLQNDGSSTHDFAVQVIYTSAT